LDTADSRPGVLIAVVAAAILILATVALPWFELEGATASAPGFPEQTLSAADLAFLEGSLPTGSLWETTSFFDIVVFALAAAALVLGVLALRGPSAARAARPVAILGGLCLLAIILAVFVLPPGIELTGDAPEGAELDPDLGLEVGVWVGLLAAAGIAAGGALAAARR
jgi:hypothetical protein